MPYFKNIFFYIFLISLSSFLSIKSVNGQGQMIFTENPVIDVRNSLFKQYTIADMDLNSLYTGVISNNKLEIKVNTQVEQFILQPTQLLSSDYTLVIAGEGGKRMYSDRSVKTFMGWTLDGRTSIVLTIDKDFFVAMIQRNEHYSFIEQLNADGKFTNAGDLVYYNAGDFINDGTHTCGVTELQDKSEKYDSPLEKRTNACGVLEMAIASDHTMYDKYGSETNVENHNISVMNNVAFNYRHEFTDNIEIQIVTQYVSTTYNDDPLSPNTTSTDISTVLDAFSAWGEGGGFGATTYDDGEMWSNRDFDGSTIGLAWVGAVCTGYRYHVLQDFSSDADLLRVMTAHEMGHNFNAGHDSGSGYIMSPSVGYTNTWSSASVTSISNYINIVSCLADCSGAQYAQFVWSPTALCNSGTVHFKDKSINSKARTWSFPSGSPNTSTAQQPDISYSSVGNYQASLTTGNGFSTRTVLNVVVVGTEPNFNTNNCALPTGNPGDLGPRLFSLADLNNPSGNAITDGSIYMNFVCSDFASLKEDSTYNFKVTVGNCSTPLFESFEVYIDYNNDGDFLDSGEKVYDYGGGGICGTPTASFTTPASVPVKNTILRLRVISDNYQNAITGPCYNPIEGQVEDYGVIFQDMTILPLELISFTGKNNGNGNQLEWKTAHEKEINNFEIQRSSVGKEFKSIGQVYGLNGSSQFNKYSYTDQTPPAGGAYYRLKINESGGSYAYSNLVYIGGKKHFYLMAIYDQGKTSLDLNITGITPDHYTIAVYSVDGRQMLNDNLNLTTGQQTLSYPMGAIRPGVYILSVHNESGDQQIQKIIVN